MKYCEKYQLAEGKMEIIISLSKRQNQELSRTTEEKSSSRLGPKNG